MTILFKSSHLNTVAIYKGEIDMKKVGITDFKAHALRLIDQVAKTNKGLVITKRGKAIVTISPFTNERDKSMPGKLSDTLIKEGDIISPVSANDWEVLS